MLSFTTLVWFESIFEKTGLLNVPCMTTSLQFPNYKLHHRPLFYENFLTALLTEPVLKYILKV